MDLRCVQCGSWFVFAATRAGARPGCCSDECRRERKRRTVTAWKQAHKQEQAAYFADRNKEFRESNPDYFKQHYAANKSRRKRESGEWYRANAEYALQRQKAYAAKRRQTHPDLLRAIGRKNRSKRRAIEKQVFVETVDPRVVFERDKGMCGICLKPVDPKSPWEVDHVIPISKGGPHSYANVQLSHRACNRSKSARLPEAVAS